MNEPAFEPDRDGLTARLLLLLMLLVPSSTCILRSSEAASTGPRICAISPLLAKPGCTNLLKIRGLKLNSATGVLKDPRLPDVLFILKEKKGADIPAGFEARDVGDTQLLVEMIVTSTNATGSVMLRIDTPEGLTPPRKIQLASNDQLQDEMEPNDGFRTAQPILAGRSVLGVIASDRDVDVFSFRANSGSRWRFEIDAAASGSLLDSILTIYSQDGKIVSSSDDESQTHDSRVRIEIRKTGTYYIAIQDANDHGGPWHGYVLRSWEER